MPLVFSLILFLGLFFLSRTLTATISFFFLRVTRSDTFAIQLLAVLFLPGVIIHELGHWLVASILFVPTGEIEFFPQVQGDHVKLGSVQIAKTDPLRRFLIGIAPVVFGVAVLLGVYWFLLPTLVPVTWKSLVFFYTVFEIGNTMISSSKDLEGALGFAVLAFLLVSLLFFLKVPLLFYLNRLTQSPVALSISATLNSFFLIAIAMDGLLIGIFRLLVKR